MTARPEELVQLRDKLVAHEVNDRSHCPECLSRLESESHSFMMAVRRGADIQPFIVGNDAAYFCSACPVVVLDYGEFERLAALSMRTSKGVQFLVVGLIDLEAVPAEKRNVPFDDDTNPVPLVEFTKSEVKVGWQNRSVKNRTNGS